MRFTYRVLKRTILKFLDDNCLDKAASLSYYSILALPGLFICIFTIAGLIWPTDEIKSFVQLGFESMVGKDGAAQIHTIIESSSHSNSGIMATILASATLIWGAIGLVGEFQYTMNSLWEVKPKTDKNGITVFLKKRILSFGMLVAIAFLLLISLIVDAFITNAGTFVSSFFSGFVADGLLLVTGNVGSIILFTFLFATIFKYLPDVQLSWRDTWVGGFMTALFFSLGKLLMAFYLGEKDYSESYGNAGSVVGLLVWIYYSSAIIFLGAEFTQVWSKMRGKIVKPEKGATVVKQHHHHHHARA